MAKHCSIGLWALITLVLTAHSLAGQATGVTPDLANQVTTLVQQLSELPPELGTLTGLSLGDIEPLEGEGGGQVYICWLMRGSQRAGYMAVVQQGKTCQVLAMSATAKDPTYFLKELRTQDLGSSTLDLSNAKVEQFVEKVPLIATGPTPVNGEPMMLWELSCAVSGLLRYWQYVKDAPLFGRQFGLFGDQLLEQDYMSRKIGDRTVQSLLGPVITDPNLMAGYFKRNEERLAARIKERNWRPYHDEQQELLIREDAVPGRPGKGMEKDAWVRARRISGPLRRQRLLDPICPQERFDVLAAEDKGVELVTRQVLTTDGQRNALLLQEDYLTPDPNNLKRDLTTFFLTRGLVGKMEVAAFGHKDYDTLPAVLVGNQRIVGLVLGYIDAAGEKLAVVYMPRTDTTKTITMGEFWRQWKERFPPQPRQPLDPKVQKILDEGRTKFPEIQKKYDRMRAAQKTRQEQEMNDPTPRGMDTLVNLPVPVDSGVHLIRCDALVSWKVLRLDGIEMGTNWGLSPSD